LAVLAIEVGRVTPLGGRARAADDVNRDLASCSRCLYRHGLALRSRTRAELPAGVDLPRADHRILLRDGDHAEGYRDQTRRHSVPASAPNRCCHGCSSNQVTQRTMKPQEGIHRTHSVTRTCAPRVVSPLRFLGAPEPGRANVIVYCESRWLATAFSIDSIVEGSTVVRWRPPLDLVMSFKTTSRFGAEPDVPRTETAQSVAPAP